MLDFKKQIEFPSYYKKFTLFSLILILASVLIFFIKGLNLGVDFKGGTLIELRVTSSAIKISDIRRSFLKMNLGDV